MLCTSLLAPRHQGEVSTLKAHSQELQKRADGLEADAASAKRAEAEALGSAASASESLAREVARLDAASKERDAASARAAIAEADSAEARAQLRQLQEQVKALKKVQGAPSVEAAAVPAASLKRQAAGDDGEQYRPSGNPPKKHEVTAQRGGSSRGVGVGKVAAASLFEADDGDDGEDWIKGAAAAPALLQPASKQQQQGRSGGGATRGPGQREDAFGMDDDDDDGNMFLSQQQANQQTDGARAGRKGLTVVAAAVR